MAFQTVEIFLTPDDVHESQIRSHIWALEWYEKICPQMTFRGQRSSSNPENVHVEYLQNGTR